MAIRMRAGWQCMQAVTGGWQLQNSKRNFSCRQCWQTNLGHARAHPAWLAALCFQCSNLLTAATALPPLPPLPLLLLPQVEEIALLKTVLVRWDGARIYYPNNKLNTELLLNLSRSANKSESLKVGGRLATFLPCPVLACPNEPCCCKQCDRAECTTGKPCARSPPALPLCLILPPPACPACSCLWTWTPRWRWWKCCGGLWRHMCAPIHQSSPATAQVGWGLSVGLGGCGSVLPVGWGRQCLAKLRLRHMAGLACNLSWGLLPTTS
jgi:hypothetical protein